MKERIQPSEIQNYNNTISTPEIYISDVDGVQVIFMLNFVAAPDFTAKLSDFNHAHTSFELQYVSDNHMAVLIDNEKKIELCAGDLLLLPPHTLHKNLTNPQEFISYSINFTIVPPSDGEVNNSRYAFYKALFSKLDNALLFHNVDIAHCVEKIFASASNPSMLSSRTKLYLRLVFEELAMLLNSENPQKLELKSMFPTQNQIDNHRKWLIDAYVSNYYMCKNHVENMSYILNLSARQTSRIVKALTNETLQALVLNQRMNVAFEKIKYSDLSLNQISEMIGYSSYTGFYVAFSNHFGYSPEKLRDDMDAKKE